MKDDDEFIITRAQLAEWFPKDHEIFDSKQAGYCDECKHWESYQGDPPICKNIKVTSLLSSCVHNGGTEYLEPPADFGCNRWEAKV